MLNIKMFSELNFKALVNITFSNGTVKSFYEFDTILSKIDSIGFGQTHRLVKRLFSTDTVPCFREFLLTLFYT